MKRSPADVETIERIEHVRGVLNRNKSQFCTAFGMRPQTFNNFIGAQGSKPSVDLIRGVSRAYNVSPEWLLFGTGPMFKGGQMPEPVKTPGIPAGTGELTERVTALEYDVGIVKALYGSSWPLLEQQAYGKTKANGSAQPEEARA